MSRSSPVRSLRTRAPVTASPLDAGRSRGGRSGSARRGRQRRARTTSWSSRLDRRVGHGERTPDARVQPGSRRSASATSISSAGARPCGSPRGTGRRSRVVVGRRDEQAAGVLDAVRDHPAQDRVLDDALVGGDAVLDDVAPAGVEQAVEAAARALGEIAPSTSTTSKPRSAASHATPAPVAPPPITSTSACKPDTWCMLSPRARGGGDRRPRPRPLSPRRPRTSRRSA